MSDVRLSEVIAEPFHPVHRDIKEHRHTHYWLKGGRGSTKSTFAAIQVVLAIKRDPDANAVVLRKVGNTMRDSVLATLIRAAEILHVADEFNVKLSPMEMVYEPTGQRIIFRGVDHPSKLKSLAVPQGSVKVVWFEELDEFYGMPEIRSVLQSLVRGPGPHVVLYTYNPPRSRDSWCNKEATRDRPDRLVHHSTYLEVPAEWLGEQFIREAEDVKAHREDAYRHEYLGEAIGMGGNVFENVEVREVTDDEIATVDRWHNGVDWGYFPHPWVFERVGYDPARRRVYVVCERSGHKLSNAETAEMVKAVLTYEPERANWDARRGAEYVRDLVWCDSAEPRSIADYRDLDIDARPVKKGPGRRHEDVRWLQALDAIVIDPARAPLAAEQFTSYEYVRTRDGAYTTAYPDEGDDAIDAVRYALSRTMRRQ